MLRVGMTEGLTLLPLGSGAGEWAKTCKKCLPYMYQFLQSRGWGVIKGCLLTTQIWGSDGNPFPGWLQTILQLLTTSAQVCTRPA